MANWSRKKVFKLAKGFKHRSKNVFGVALRKTRRGQQFSYRDRRVKKRTVRRTWISQINAAVREHGITYSKFANALVKKSNIEIDRKILSGLAINEPYSFKCMIDEVRLQAGLQEAIQRRPMIGQVTAISLPEAFEKGLIVERRRPEEIDAIIHSEPKAELYGLRFPERDAKTERDYMRISFTEED
jgi:large subunit ribosomal protein L20